jgi:hypothetical protein
VDKQMGHYASKLNNPGQIQSRSNKVFRVEKTEIATRKYNQKKSAGYIAN